MYIYKCILLYIYVYIHIYIYIFYYIYFVCMYIYVYIPFAYTCIYTCIYIYLSHFVSEASPFFVRAAIAFLPFLPRFFLLALTGLDRLDDINKTSHNIFDSHCLCLTRVAFKGTQQPACVCACVRVCVCLCLYVQV